MSNPYTLPREYVQPWLVTHAPRAVSVAVEELYLERDRLERQAARLRRERDDLRSTLDMISLRLASK